MTKNEVVGARKGDEVFELRRVEYCRLLVETLLVVPLGRKVNESPP